MVRLEATLLLGLLDTTRSTQVVVALAVGSRSVQGGSASVLVVLVSKSFQGNQMPIICGRGTTAARRTPSCEAEGVLASGGEAVDSGALQVGTAKLLTPLPYLL